MAEPMDSEASDTASAAPADSAVAPRFSSALEAKELGNEAYKRKDYNDAISYYTAAIDMAPNEPAYLNNRCAAYMMLGRHEDAARDAQSALTLDPNNAKYHHRAAKCYTSLWRLGDAQRHYAETLRLEPGNADAAKESKNVDQLFVLARNVDESFAAKQYNNAISLLDRALQTAPNASKLRLRQAEAYVLTKQLDQAENIAVNLLRINRNDIDALYWRGIVLQRRGELEEAIKHFQSALRLDPDHGPSAQQLKIARQMMRTKEEGTTHFNANRYDEAYAAYSKCLELDPTNDAWNSKLNFNCAMVLSKKGDLKGALKACTAALDLDSKYQKALAKRAQLHMQLEMYEEAVRDYDSLKELDPSNNEVRQGLKTAQLELKKSKRIDYYKVLEVARDADEQTIQKAYKRLARTWHPDRHQSPEAKEEADKKFKMIGEAYQVLSDPRKKQQYDSGQDLDGGGGGGMDPNEVFAHMFGGGGGGGGFGGFGGFPGGFSFGGGGFPGGFGGGGRHGHGHARRSYDYDDDE